VVIIFRTIIHSVQNELEINFQNLLFLPLSLSTFKIDRSAPVIEISEYNRQTRAAGAERMVARGEINQSPFFPSGTTPRGGTMGGIPD